MGFHFLKNIFPHCPDDEQLAIITVAMSLILENARMPAVCEEIMDGRDAFGRGIVREQHSTNCGLLWSAIFCIRHVQWGNCLCGQGQGQDLCPRDTGSAGGGGSYRQVLLPCINWI
jgi:hypothetical protein